MKRNALALPMKKKRLARTNYRKRLQLLSSGKPRLVVRKTLRHILLQLVIYEEEGDKILLSANSKELLKKGWTAFTGNIPAAYLTGLLFATKIKKAGVNAMVVDTGFHTSVYGSRIYAALKGVLDGGVAINVDKKIFPSDDRIMGKHIEQHAEKSTQFTKSSAKISSQLEKIKTELLQSS